MNWTMIAEWLFDSPVSGLWPVLAIPALSALLSDRAARRLPPTRADWRVAAALAALPGLVLLVLLAVAIGRSVVHLHPDGPRHFIQYHFVWLAAPAILIPAAAKAFRRHRQLRALTKLTVAPQPRLSAAAREAGIEVRELPILSRECFVAGLRRPLAYVSSGAVEALSDQELRAALFHERAHAEGRDPAVLALLAFLADLVPASSSLLAYRQARERDADIAAARRAGVLALAAALLVFRRSQSRFAVGMAGADAEWRLRAILDLEPTPTQQHVPRAVAAALTFNSTLIAWPAAQVSFALLLCSS